MGFNHQTLLEVAAILDEDWIWTMASTTKGTRALNDPLLAVDLADFVRIKDRPALGFYADYTHEGA